MTYIENLIREQNSSIYMCAKESKLAYTTVLDLAKGKTDINKCSVETVLKLSRYLHVSVEDLVKNFNLSPTDDFEIFKSAICHQVKEKGDIPFIMEILQRKIITKYWKKHQWREAFYTLAMIDYLCSQNSLPLCSDYDHIRDKKLEKPLYPRDISLAQKLNLNTEEEIEKHAIPEFLRFNIIESKVRDVV